MRGETVVITGGNGFVGRHLISELRKETPDTEVIVWDRSVEGMPDYVKGVKIDITDPESYRESLQAGQPAWIVHLAAVPSAALASQNEEYAWRVNVEGTRQLLEEVKQISPDTCVLVASSADIYGGQENNNPLVELSLEQARPRNTYAQTKWEMEKIIERDFNDRVLRVRPFPHIGPGQSLGFVTADFASQIAAIERGKQKPVLKVGNLEAKRDFTDVRDVVCAYRLLMERGVCGEVYNVASGEAVSIQHILDKLLKLSEVEITVEQDEKLMRPSDMPVMVGDATKLKKAAAWRPTIFLDKSLKDILDYWRSL
ncbi:MAG: NAD-dependent epimerase/dehydratase family protein [bacterium]